MESKRSLAWSQRGRLIGAGASGPSAPRSFIILLWAVTGPVFGFSDSWQLIINTGTTIVTFLMVFLIQHAQNRDTRAIQLKLNELIAAVEGASNRLIDVEDLEEEELEHLHARYQKLVKHATHLHEGAHTSVDNE